MTLARDLVELERQLRDREVDLFLPIDRGGLVATPEFATLLAHLPQQYSSATVRLCLQALRIQYEEMRKEFVNAELVATLPPGTPGVARATKSVLGEMIGTASTEIIVLGYELSDPSLILLLANATQRGVTVIMICDRSRGAAARVLATWPHGLQLPRVFHDRERSAGLPYAAMHAKCVLVDCQDLLVTSANFTFHGLQGNIEIGVRLRGSPAQEARKIFSHLVENRIVEELSKQDGGTG